MNDPTGDHLPEDVSPAVSRLRAERAQLDPLQSDQLKQRVLARARDNRHPGGLMKSRIATLLTLVALASATGGALAVAGGGPSGSGQTSAAKSQYRPGKGCGDRNHHHTGSHGKQKPCPEPHHHRDRGDHGRH